MGETWCRGNYIFTFFYLFYCFHQVIITHIRYYGLVTIYFARMEHCTHIGKALKIHLKIISFAKTEPSAMNVKARDYNNEMQTNHRPVFQSCDNNITKKKHVAGKPAKNNNFNQTLHAYLRHLDMLKMAKTYIIGLL